MSESAGDWLSSKVVPAVQKFTSLKPIQALRGGVLVVMPLTIVGSVFLLLAFFPVSAVATWFAEIGLTPLLMQVYAATFNVIGLVACTAITYNYVKASGYESYVPSIFGLSTFVLFLDLNVVDPETGVTFANVITMTWTGARGLILGIIIGEFVGAVYAWFLKRNIVIKMPDGVPPAVVNSFTALIPGTVVLTISMFVWGFLRARDTNLPEMIYNSLQTPLQGLSDSLGGALVISFLVPFLWWFGIHGSSIVSGVAQPLLTANAVENQAILDSGRELTVANGGHIVTQQFLDNGITMTGAGITLGVVLYMLVRARSSQYKTLGRLATGPAAFNINEPIIFGTPIVVNPLMAIPFIATPIIAGAIQYFALWSGLVPLYTGVLAPWTTPPIISGFIIGDWRTAVMQAVILAISVVVYLPFIRKMDRMAKAEEDAAHAEHVAAQERAALAAAQREREHAEFVALHPEAR